MKTQEQNEYVLFVKYIYFLNIWATKPDQNLQLVCQVEV